MTKIWGQAYLKPLPEDRTVRALPSGARVALYAPICVLVVVSLAMGLWPAPFLAVAGQAATDLVEPARYIAAVTGTEVRP